MDKMLIARGIRKHGFAVFLMISYIAGSIINSERTNRSEEIPLDDLKNVGRLPNNVLKDIRDNTLENFVAQDNNYVVTVKRLGES